MENKTFELLTQMYNEFNNRFDQVNNRFDQVNNRLDKVDNRLDKVDKRFDQTDKQFNHVNKRLDRIEISIENDIKPDIKATLDGYKQLAEGQEEIKAQLIELSSRVDNQEVEITALRRAK